jgi:hypothetical protein
VSWLRERKRERHAARDAQDTSSDRVVVGLAVLHENSSLQLKENPDGYAAEIAGASIITSRTLRLFQSGRSITA